MADLELVDKPFFTWIKEDLLYRTLYLPIERLDSFLADNRHLFTLIGVFGAVAVYVRTVEDEISASLGELGDFAVFSGLGILVLLSILVLIKLWIEIRRVGGWEGLFLYFFSALFFPLVVVISGLISTFAHVVGFYVYMVVYLLGFGTSLFITYSFAWIAYNAEQRVSTSVRLVEMGSMLLAVLVLVIVIGVIDPPSDLPTSFNMSELPTWNEWVDVYTLFTLGFAAFFVLTAFVLNLLYTVAMSIIYAGLRLWSGINRLWVWT